MKKVRTAVVVTAVAVLIWVFAEGESLRTQTVGARVLIKAPTSTALRVIEPEGLNDGAIGVSLTFRGSTAAIDSIRTELDNIVELDRTNGIPNTPGEHQIDLAEVLRHARPIADSGISIIEVEPSLLRLSIISLEEISLPVVAQVEGELEGAPLVSPERVVVKAPSDLIARLGANATVTARVRPERVRGLSLGVVSVLERIPLELPAPLAGAFGVGEPQPAFATVTMTLRDTTSSALLSQVPVQIVLATSEVGRWDIEIDDPLIEDVTIRGPSDLIDRVVNGTGTGGRVRVLAYLPLSFEELEQGITSKEVEFRLSPARAGTLQFEAEDTIVGITIKKREQPTGEPSPP